MWKWTGRKIRWLMIIPFFAGILALQAGCDVEILIDQNSDYGIETGIDKIVDGVMDIIDYFD